MAKKAAQIPVKKKPEYEKVEMVGAEVLGDEFLEAAAEIAELTKVKKEAEAAIKEKYAVLKAMMEDMDDSQSWSVRDPEERWSVRYMRPEPRKTLVKELLIQQGVTMKQIQKATKETPVTPYVTLRLAGEEE